MFTDLIYERSMCYADDTCDWFLTCTGRNRDIDTGASAWFFLFCHFVISIKYLKHFRGSEEDYLPTIQSSNIKNNNKQILRDSSSHVPKDLFKSLFSAKLQTDSHIFARLIRIKLVEKAHWFDFALNLQHDIHVEERSRK